MFDPWAHQRMIDPSKLEPKARGARSASNLICGRIRPTKAKIVEFCLGLDDAEVAGAQDSFHAQGPRLWGFWCDAMRKRHKAGKGGVPDYMRGK